ncbi:adhesion G protein-coupled receptor F5 isoform X2 [Thalassophryne amazonica]|uniref:adhesion G protein-coupled receptor F5 isoform X2 n=1 Tax=Thalassophryne amazonica TaxID=390379 RepID=UPI0014713ED5|nr:adhesion G protein-coupled receptor F5 isoform X2 [Thalassophryne amazonica]
MMARCVTVLLTLCYIMDTVEHGLCLNMVKELAVTRVSPIHARAKRETDFLYTLEAVVRVTDVGQFLAWLKTLGPPLSLNESATLTNIDHTTVCPRIGNEFLCFCEAQFTWSQRQCSSSTRCDDSTKDLCRCIVKTDPLDNQFCQPPIERKEEFTMDITFDTSFNNPDHTMFKEISTSIKNNAERYFPTLVAAGLTGFRSGSTIAQYSINATSFLAADFENFRRGIITDLGRKFNMIVDSSVPLQFSSNVTIAEEKLNVICGPPPEDLKFMSNWTSEWRHDGEIIIPSRRIIISDGDGNSLVQSVLTVLGLVSSDSGLYECLLKDEIVFLQVSSKALIVEEKPVIEVNTIRKAVHCEVGHDIVVPLECSVQSIYNIELVRTDDSVADPSNPVETGC